MTTEEVTNSDVAEKTIEVTSSPNIDNILENIKRKGVQEQLPKKQPASKKSKLKREQLIPRGQPKSGRPWKEPKKKFSSIKKSIYHRSFEKKMKFRNEIKQIKEVSNSIKEAKKQSNEMKKQRRLENAERRLANERRSEVVQVIKNPAKLKRLRKKQLRQIEKRDLDKVKVV